MQVITTENFKKIIPEEGFYILSLKDNFVTNTPMYLSLIDNIDDYTEITAEQAKVIIDSQVELAIVIPDICPFDHCENLYCNAH